MTILYDMQQQFESLVEGVFNGANSIKPTGSVLLNILDIEGTKSIFVSRRADKNAGIGIKISEMDGVSPGDRITITGRFRADAPSGSWGIAMIAIDTDPDAPENQLAHQIAPKSVFALSHVLEETEMNSTIVLHTTSWGLQNPIMDFNVDNVFVSRNVSESNILADTRGIVYSMENDWRIRDYGIKPDIPQKLSGTEFLQGAGNPKISIIKRGKTNVLHVGNRFRDFDAVDVVLGSLNLLKGNKYQVTATGRIDGNPPEGSLMLMQSTPGYSWLASKFVSKNDEFTLTYTLTPSGIEKWTSIRISSNVIGAHISFFIYSIVVESLGVFGRAGAV